MPRYLSTTISGADPEEFIRVLREYAGMGYSITALAIILGSDYKTVNKHALLQGLLITGPSKPGLPYPSLKVDRQAPILKLLEKIRPLAKEWYGPIVIAKKVGCTDFEVKKLCAEYRIKLALRTPEGKVVRHGFPRAALERAAEKKTVWVEWSGGREKRKDAAQRLGISSEALQHRIDTWGVERAMSTPRVLRVGEACLMGTVTLVDRGAPENNCT